MFVSIGKLNMCILIIVYRYCYIHCLKENDNIDLLTGVSCMFTVDKNMLLSLRKNRIPRCCVLA